MARLTRLRPAVRLVAAIGALALPLWLLSAPAAAPVAVVPPSPPLSPPSAPPPLRAAFARTLFAAPPADAAVPADAPQLIGIVGRLGRDAVALVRGSNGTRTLTPGDSVDGWQLRSLAIDAAYFTRGAQTARVPVPGEDQR